MEYSRYWLRAVFSYLYLEKALKDWRKCLTTSLNYMKKNNNYYKKSIKIRTKSSLFKNTG